MPEPHATAASENYMTMIKVTRSRRVSAKTTVALAAVILLNAGLISAQLSIAAEPLIAYVGTFSSPLHDVLPTQVDLPPGNGRGIHLFKVDRATGLMSTIGVREIPSSPSCLVVNAAGTRLYSANETDRSGDKNE